MRHSFTRVNIAVHSHLIQLGLEFVELIISVTEISAFDQTMSWQGQCYCHAMDNKSLCHPPNPNRNVTLYTLIYCIIEAKLGIEAGRECSLVLCVKESANTKGSKLNLCPDE